MEREPYVALGDLEIEIEEAWKEATRLHGRVPEFGIDYPVWPGIQNDVGTRDV